MVSQTSYKNVCCSLINCRCGFFNLLRAIRLHFGISMIDFYIHVVINEIYYWGTSDRFVRIINTVIALMVGFWTDARWRWLPISATVASTGRAFGWADFNCSGRAARATATIKSRNGTCICFPFFIRADSRTKWTCAVTFFRLPTGFDMSRCWAFGRNGEAVAWRVVQWVTRSR